MRTETCERRKVPPSRLSFFFDTPVQKKTGVLYHEIIFCGGEVWLVSFKLCNKLDTRDGLTYAQYTVLWRMAYMSVDDHSIGVSLSTLADRLRCNERNVQRNIHSLIKLGVLMPAGSAGGRGNIQAYHICLDILPQHEKKKPLRRNRKIQDAYAPVEFEQTEEPLDYIPLFAGEIFNVEYAIKTLHWWENKVKTENPHDPKYGYSLDGLRDSRAELEAHGIILEKEEVVE